MTGRRRSGRPDARRIRCPLLGGDPDAPALIDAPSGHVLSYAQLDRAVRARVAELDARPTRLMWLYARNDVPTMLAYLAAVTSGMPVAVADPGLPFEVRESLEAAYRPELVVGARPATSSDAVEIRNETWRCRYAPDLPVLAPHPELALLLLTSGSTGSAKAVRLSREAVLTNAGAIGQSLRLDPSSRAVTSLPPYYTYGLSVLNSHLLAGASIVLTGTGLLDPDFRRVLDDYRVTHLAGVPQSYAILHRLGFFDRLPRHLQVLTQAGGRLDAELLRAVADRAVAADVDFYVMYGQTEATARISVLPPWALPAKLGSVGRAVPGLDVRTDPTSDEVLVSGRSVMLGYATSRADLARGDEMNGVLSTGDLGHLDEDGCLWLTGRSKRIAKLSGVRINLDDVERLAADEWDGGSVAAVCAQERVRIYGEADGCEEPAVDVQRAVARRLRLPAFLFEVAVLPQLPRTRNGKIAYAELESP